MRSVLFLLSILVISSCSLLNDSDTKEAEQLIPLEVGNSWVIDRNRYNGEIFTDTLSVVSDTLIGNKTWYKLESDYLILDQHFRGYYLNHKDGLYKYSGSEEVSGNILLFKNTDDQGEVFVNETESTKWVTVYDGEEQDESFGVASKNYTVEYEYISSPNRTYTIDQTYHFQRVISPEVGIIKWESAYMSPLNDSTLTLLERGRFSFTLKEFIPAD